MPSFHLSGNCLTSLLCLKMETRALYRELQTNFFNVRCCEGSRTMHHASTVPYYITLSRHVAQYGFVRRKSCTSQLLSVFHQISQNLDSGRQTDILYLDTVDHKHLIKKLSQYGLSGNMLIWLKDYLSGPKSRYYKERQVDRKKRKAIRW